MKSALLLDPHYQRQGDVWSRERRRLLIDSILNGFIVPPMYWHVVEPSSEYYNGELRYAVVDGRQRLEAIFAFLDDGLVFGKENALLSDPKLELEGMSLSDLREQHGWLYASLMRASMEVVIIETSEVDLIEELFSRLNEGVPLSASEKRNRGVVLAPLVRGFTERHEFFSSRLPFGNRRYRHYDLLAKLMRIEDRGISEARIPDLRKVDLDRLFNRLREKESTDSGAVTLEVEALLAQVEANLNALNQIFEPDDRYLSSVGMVTVYYSICHVLRAAGEDPLTREEVEHFEGLRQAVKGKDDEDLNDVELLVVEFAHYSQGTTSGSYLSARLKIFLQVERGWKFHDSASLS
jgi:Protein of unknown function DUF262